MGQGGVSDNRGVVSGVGDNRGVVSGVGNNRGVVGGGGVGRLRVGLSLVSHISDESIHVICVVRHNLATAIGSSTLYSPLTTPASSWVSVLAKCL